MEFELHILAVACMEFLLTIFFCWKLFFFEKFLLLLLEKIKLLKKRNYLETTKQYKKIQKRNIKIIQTVKIRKILKENEK